MDSFNVLRGREPVRATGGKYYCAGYIKYLPQRGAIYGIEFSNTKDVDLPTFKYYIFASENAFLNYVADMLDVEQNADGTIPGTDIPYVATTPTPILKSRFSKRKMDVGNPSSYIVSAGEYTSATKSYPMNIGFQGADYQHDPRPYSNLDGFVDSNDVQYPLYLVVEFDEEPKKSTKKLVSLDYQIIIQS